MKTETAPNYTAAQEQLIRDAADQNGGVLNFEIATTLAGNPLMNASDGSARKPRSIVAKITRMGVTYKAKEPTTKDGSAIVKKDELVAAIAKRVGGNLEGLNKAPKPALVAIRDFVDSVAVAA